MVFCDATVSVIALVVLTALRVGAQVDDGLIKMRAPRVVLTHFKLIDGTGAPAVDDRQ